MQKIFTWLNGIFTIVHNFIASVLNSWHGYMKAILSLAWKLAVLLLILDILFKTKFGIFQAILNLIKGFGGISLGAGIAIAVISLSIGVIVAVFEKKN
jgi:hypothetical protein